MTTILSVPTQDFIKSQLEGSSVPVAENTITLIELLDLPPDIQEDQVSVTLKDGQVVFKSESAERARSFYLIIRIDDGLLLAAGCSYGLQNTKESSDDYSVSESEAIRIAKLILDSYGLNYVVNSNSLRDHKGMWDIEEVKACNAPLCSPISMIIGRKVGHIGFDESRMLPGNCDLPSSPDGLMQDPRFKERLKALIRPQLGTWQRRWVDPLHFEERHGDLATSVEVRKGMLVWMLEVEHMGVRLGAKQLTLGHRLDAKPRWVPWPRLAPIKSCFLFGGSEGELFLFVHDYDDHIGFL